MKFSDFRIARKLVVSFGAVVCVIMLSSVFVFLQTNGLREYLRLNNVSDEAIDHVDQMRGDVTAAQSAARKLVVTGVEGDKAAYTKALTAYAEHMAAVKTVLAKDGPELLPQLLKYEAAVTAHVTKGMGEEVRLALSPATRNQAVEMILSGVLGPEIAALEQASTALHNDVAQWSDGWTEKAGTAMSQMVLVVAGSGVLSTILAGLMGWLLARTIGQPIRSVTQTMQALAAGNTAVAVSAIGRKDEIGEMADAVQVFKEAAIEKVRLEGEADAARRASDDERARNAAMLAEAARQQGQVVESLASGLARLSEGNLVFRLNNAFTPEYEQLRSDFNAAIGKLHDTMQLVATNATTIRSGTSEISTASDDLSRRTEQQAASLEETAAALDEITSTVRRTAEGAKHASAVVSGAKTEAEQSSRVVRQAVEAMGGIQKSSREIGNIIGVIDEIAFQTNLLALNAGVEAARAGDAGRGFAVVASEVRALAQRSAEAAKEIKSLISTSGAQVEQGVAFVGQTGEALARMMAQVNEIDGIVGEISASAQEQATALHQVNTAVNQMDQVTQQNAAMVEESTAASQSLSEQTGELARLIDQFQVGEGGASPARRPAPAAKPAPRPSQAPVAAMRTVGRGGAARMPEPAAEDWTEF